LAMKRPTVRIPAFASVVPVIALAALAAACGGNSFSSQTADVAGDYTVDLKTGDNGCMFTSWTPGSSTMNVPVTLTQQGTTVTATVGGLAAAVLDLVLGTAQFQGTVTGDSFSLSAFGTAHATDGDCSYTLKATLAGSISGDSIQGQITYSESTNGSPACSYHATCTSVQNFDGVRAPSADGG
jgi:hypothetical protein